jgi:hypothetical protein
VLLQKASQAFAADLLLAFDDKGDVAWERVPVSK